MPNLTDSEEAYVTLFCEGDGSLYVNKAYSGLYPRITFSQSERHVLEYIHNLIGSNNRISPNSKRGWTLPTNGRNCIPLLGIFSRHVVGKQFLDKLNNLNTMYNLPHTTQHPINTMGLVGFWDAEGSSAYTGTLLLSMSQKDREILDIIANTFGGSVGPHENNYQWQLTGKSAKELALKILKRSHCPSKKERLRKNLYPAVEHKEAIQIKFHEHYLKNRDKILTELRRQNLLIRACKELINE